MDSQSTNREPAGRTRRTFSYIAYWFNLVVQPLLAIVFIIGLVWLFGFVQREYRWFNDAQPTAEVALNSQDASYACSMLCVFMKAPGRCPVCGMELQKIEASGDPKDFYGITIEPAARRLSNIETITAMTQPVDRELKVLGRITADETTEETVSAYFDGRIEKLHVNYTGASVKKGDALAVLFAPEIYTDQVGLLEAKKSAQQPSNNQRVNQSNQRLYESAKRRLIEQGLTENQIALLESKGTVDSRIPIHAPSTGTVVKKLVKEGDYIKTGSPILKIADLSQVWLMLQMFPGDAAKLELGQEVSVKIQSVSGVSFEGRVAFIDPMVEQRTQTVNVRVQLPNDAGLIKIGDLGTATIRQVRNRDLRQVVVPRESVLTNGSHSVAYVETKPGRFEFRKVTVGEILGDQILVQEGIKAGEQVVASGAFMIDSTFNIQGKPSLIDPDRLRVQDQTRLANVEAEEKEIQLAFAKLSPEDRRLAEYQFVCPVTEVKLGTKGMGAPIRIQIDDREVMICCAGCESRLKKEPEKYLAWLDEFLRDQPSFAEYTEMVAAFQTLSESDRRLAEQQVICPISEVRLGTHGMGTPITVAVNGAQVMICCEGCRTALLEDPQKYLEVLKRYQEKRSRQPNGVRDQLGVSSKASQTEAKK